MIKKTLLVVILFLCSLLVFLVAYMPASVAWKYLVSPAVNPDAVGFKARAFEGTVWNGRMHWSFRHLEGIGAWDISLADWYAAEIPIDMDIESNAGVIRGNAVVGLASQQLNLDKIDVSLAQLNPFVRAQRLRLDGEFSGLNVSLDIDDQSVTAAQGRFSWTGGDISYPAGRSRHERSMPRFTGALSTESTGDIRIGIRDEDASFDVLRGVWTNAGDASWEVTRRVLDIAQEPWSPNSTETDVVFKLKKPISRNLGAL